MLQLIRDRATGWIAWFIIILICVPFALWGIQEYVSPQGSLTVAEVNDSEIGYYQFQNAYQMQRRQLERMLGQRISDPGMERALRDETLERLINDELLVQAVVDNGLRVGDGQLAEAIRGLPAFQGASGFTQEVYNSYLRARGLSAEGFELDLRRSLLGEQLISAIQRSELVTRADIDRVWAQQNRLRRYRRMVIAPASLSVDEPGDDAVASYFEAHRDQYVKPERVKIAYIEVAREEIAAGVPVEEQELRAIYESSKANYKTDEQREARHILVQVARDADGDAAAEARTRIDALRARIVGGEEFAEVARLESEDPGSASSGGSLGFFGRQVMDPAFEEAAFGLARGTLSEPVRSSFGWHLIEVTDIQEEQIRGFESVRADMEEEYRSRQAESLYAERVEELANLAFEHPTSLEVAAEALDIQPAVTGFFARSGEDAGGIAANGRVRSAAFSLEVLDEGNNSELLELAPGRVAVIRLLERESARPLSLDEAKERIRAELLADARAARATELGEEILGALNAGGELDQVARDHDQEFQEVAEASPANPGALDGALQRRLFSMPALPGESRPGFAGMPMDSGGYQILALLEVQEAPSKPTAEQVRETRGQLEGALGAESFGAVMGALRGRADVRVFEETLSSEEL